MSNEALSYILSLSLSNTSNTWTTQPSWQYFVIVMIPLLWLRGEDLQDRVIYENCHCWPAVDGVVCCVNHLENSRRSHEAPDRPRALLANLTVLPIDENHVGQNFGKGEKSSQNTMVA